MGYTFVGWESTYVTNNQHLLGSGDQHLLFSQTQPTTMPAETTYRNNLTQYEITKIAGKKINTFTDKVTICVWAKMDDWTKFATSTSSANRILSCYDDSKAGWDIGTVTDNTDLRIKWNLGDTNESETTQARSLYFSPGNTDLADGYKWKDLASGWHMFSFTVGPASDGTQRMWGYIDGGTSNATSGVSALGAGNRYKTAEGGKVNYGNVSKLRVGGKYSPEGSSVTPFTGEIGSVVVTDIWTAGTKATANKTAFETMMAKFYDRFKTYLYTGMGGTSYEFKSMWKANASASVNLDLTYEKKDANGNLIDTYMATIDKSVSSQLASSRLAGTSVALVHPTLDDHVFLHWRAAASRHVSKNQNFDYKKLSISSDETETFEDLPAGEVFAPTPSGETVVEEFDGNTYYFITEPSDADNTYRYRDSLTVTVWATMDDWSDFKPDEATAMRIFSCAGEDKTGFSLKDSNEEGVSNDRRIAFLGHETNLKGVNDTRAARTNADAPLGTWEKLNREIGNRDANWHMFTYVFDGQYIRGYIDDQLVAISPRFESGKIVYPSTYTKGQLTAVPIAIGGQPAVGYARTANAHIFKGAMKNFAVIHTPLTPSQVKELYDNPATTYCYYPDTNKDLMAAWKSLEKLSAQDIEIHAIAGEPVEYPFAITDNGMFPTTVNVAGANTGDARFYSGETVGVNEAAVVTYVPNDEYVENGVNTHTTTFGLDAANSASVADTTYSITGYTHRFDIAYWNHDGFAALMDEGLAAPQGGSMLVKMVPVSAPTAEVSSKISKRSDGTYLIGLTDKDGDSLSDQEVDITFEYTHASDASKNWTIKTRRWIPKFVAGDVLTAADIHNDHRDVMITGENVTLSSDLTGENALGDVYVHPEATFVLEAGRKLQVRSLVLYGDGAGNSPNVSISSNSILNIDHDKPTIYYSKRINGAENRWHFFSLPYDCKIEDIHFADGSGGNYNGGIYLKYYDGAYRAQNQTVDNNWKWISNNKATLKAGQGYIVTISTKAGVKDVVFPMHIAKEAGEEDEPLHLHDLDNAEKTIALDTHVEYIKSPTANPGYFGWNFVGSQYLTTYAFPDGDESVLANLKTGAVYVDDEESQGYVYVTVPCTDKNFNEYYEQKIYKNHDIAPFSAFFVQAGGEESSVNLDFVPSSRKQSQSIVARKKSAASAKKRTYVGVTLASDIYSDETSLVIGNHFTQAYEIGSDLEKMLGLGTYPQVYVNDASHKYAFKSLSEADAAGTNDLGVYLPAAGEYTFAVNENYDYSGVQAIHLTDKQTGITLNLLQTPYTFTSDKAHTTTRFALSAVLSADVATDLAGNNGTAMAWAVWQDAPLHIRVQGLTMGETVRIFDCMGHLVMQTVADEVVMAFSLPAEGAYCIQTVSAQGTQAKKIMVK